MTGFRLAGWALIFLMAFAQTGLLGLHEPEYPGGLIILCTAWIILAICSAADYVKHDDSN